jgi:hypothetical protein
VTGLMVAGDVVLTEGERRLLARAATRIYEAQRYTYSWDPDPEKRQQLLLRWQAIADALHPEPYGPEQRALELAQREREATVDSPAWVIR